MPQRPRYSLFGYVNVLAVAGILLGAIPAPDRAFHPPRSLPIFLDLANDLVLPEHLPEWTQVAWSVLGLTALVMLGAMAWATTLKRRVDEQTEILREKVGREATLKDRYRELFENAYDVVFLCGLRGHFTSLNKAGERVTGYSRAELIGTNIREIVAPEYISLVERMIQPKGSEQGQPPHELEIVARDGRRVPLEITTRLIYSEGAAIGLQGIARDISERKRAEDALRSSERRYRQLFERNLAGVFHSALDGRILDCNNSFAQMFGYRSREEMLSSPGWRFPSGAGDREMILVRLREGKPVTNFELVERRKDGSRVWLLESASLIESQDGNAAEIEGTLIDVTGRKLIETELRRAKEAAETANRAKSGFLAAMSHEIRTPMNAIIGMTELALDTGLTAEQREYLEMVRTSALSLLTVINDILDFSKIEAGKLEFDRVGFDLRSSLSQVLKTLALRADEKGLELAYQVLPNVPNLLVGDPGRLRQVIINLVGNAIKFTERGEVVVRVETDPVVKDEVVLQFTVTDTGVGIPREQQQAIFEAFVQPDALRTRRSGGTGLGLAISQRLAQKMGGRIWVESELGRGSTFHFTARFALSQSHPAAPVVVEPGELRGLRVLVVEDNATNRRLLREILTRWHMSPALAEGGKNGLRALEEALEAGQPFPLVLLDSRMPDMDGFTLADRIKRNPALAGAAIMMLTSAGIRGDAARCREMGVAAYLTKPIRQSELFDAIVTVLAKAPSKQQVPPLVTRHWLRESRQHLRVLLAEDNPANQKVLVRLLEKHGHTVFVANNGKEALARLEQSAFEGFDLVLLDVQMPEMGGLQVVAAVREKEKLTGEHLPIIAVTAHAMKGDRERCLKAGMDGYVSKPIHAEELFAVMESLARRLSADEVQLRGTPVVCEAMDRTAALERVEGDAELLAEMARIFLVECPTFLSGLRDALAQHDSKALERIAHKVKGSVGNFAARRASEAVRGLESLSRGGDWTQAEEACRILEKEIERLAPELKGLVEKAVS